MNRVTPVRPTSALEATVRQLLHRRLRCLGEFLKPADITRLMAGKMLRTRFAARLAGNRFGPPDFSTVVFACAAIELVHTASLCHDDVIDNAFLRRGGPALWTMTGPSGAVLIGDLLLCDAVDLLARADQGRLVGAFIAKLREVCAAEAEQELLLRGSTVDERNCLRIARAKTGPLFAFVAMLCAGQDTALGVALEEVGYRVGTIYQLTDDLLDFVGDEGAAGKTLRTDGSRRKFTLAYRLSNDQSRIGAYVSDLCAAALDDLRRWPVALGRFRAFLDHDLRPLLERQLGQPCLSEGAAS